MVSMRATDGRRLAMVLTEGEATEPVVIDAKRLKMGAKPFIAELNGTLRTTPIVGKGQVANVTESAEPTVEGLYPKIGPCLPSIDAESYAAVSLDYEFLTQMAAAIRPKIEGDSERSITVYFPKSGAGPTIFRHGQNLGLVMPRESEKTAKEIEAYQDAIKAHAL